MERSILHLDMDTFFVAVEQRNNVTLKGKPVIVGGSSERGVVSSCSYETRIQGVRSGMAMRLAKQLCPDAIVVRGDYQAYEQASELVTEIIEESAPFYEKNSIDEFNCDLTGMDRYVGCWGWSRELKRKIVKESGLPVTIALSENRTISKMAANEVKPNGEIQLEKQLIKPFISPLSVGKIPMVGQVTAQTLRTMGVARVGTLSMIPPLLMERTFGKPGKTLWERANGIDLTPIVPYVRRKSISKETTYPTDTTDLTQLRATLMSMVEQLAFELRGRQQCTALISVKIRYSDFSTYSQQASLPPTSSDHELLKSVFLLFEKLYQRRVLVRLVGVSFGKLVRGKEQLNLFDDSSKIAPLYQAMDEIRKKYGEKAIGKADCFNRK